MVPDQKESQWLANLRTKGYDEGQGLQQGAS